jgi:sulfur relay (sulfurtransferase) complex TusBCD TusD component (DsrE family)
MEQKILILINDAPYGTEKAYNGLRLAMQLQRLQFLINIFATAQKISLNYKFKIWRVYYEIA